MSENATIDNINNDEVRLYELGINLIPTLEEKVQGEFEGIKIIIKNHGGEIVSESTPVTIPLAYTMIKNIDSKNIKYNNASFGWVKFNITPDQIELIKEELDLNAEILRYVILKTTEAANTTSEVIAESLSKKSEVSDDRKKRRSSDDDAEVVEEVVAEEVVNAEEVDEAIEALVSEDK
ncbi:MAG: 30S ribosomal protein S6 [Candidatus Pacebacteria bacterium]|nr:30S ribosomal protein S6 [Candidatus Paceibacterota bacterium]